jgi:hypothetical protein
MAAKSKRGVAISGRAPAKGRAVAGKQGAAGGSKPIGNTRAGRRTTLRVPRALEAEVARTARELDISDNEALVRLAQLGAVAAERRRDVRRVIDDRQAAVSRADANRRPRNLPAPEEMQEAILVDRN